MQFSKNYRGDQTDTSPHPSPAVLGLKKTEVKLDLLTNIDMLLIAEKSIRRRMCHSTYRNEKANNEYMEDYDKTEESSCIQHLDVNNLWAMSQKLVVNNFEWIKDTSQFNEDFIRNYYEESDKGWFLEVDVQYTKKLNKFQTYLSFFTREDEN